MVEWDRDCGFLFFDWDWDRGLYLCDDRCCGWDVDWIIERERGDKDRIIDCE